MKPVFIPCKVNEIYQQRKDTFMLLLSNAPTQAEKSYFGMWFAVNCVNYLACILKTGHMCAEKVVENRIWQNSSFFFFFPFAMEK